MNTLDYLLSPIITLRVGTEGDHQQSFAVHKSLICSRSMNIATALKPNRFQEGKDLSISFPEDDPAIFATYLTYLYRPDKLDSVLTSTTWHNFITTYTGLCALYSLSEMLIDDTMKDWVCNILYELSYKPFHCRATINLTSKLHPPSVQAIQVIYNGTSDGDRMRVLLTQLFAEHGYDEYVKDIIKAAQGDLPAGFTHDFAVAVMSVRATPRGYLDMVQEPYETGEEEGLSEYFTDEAEKEVLHEEKRRE